jgi:uncharacterized protein involved in exopolysaccharide biosynthesis/Mrp family chromosome partitioning ATPase
MNALDPRSQPALRAPFAASAPPPDDTADIAAVLRIVRRRMVLITGVTILIVALAFPLILRIEKHYYAESRLLIQSSLVAPEAGEQQQLDISTEVERLLSRTIAERVIRDLKLDRSEEFNPELRPEPLIDGMRASVRGLFPTEPSLQVESDPMDRIVPEFQGALSVSRNGLSQVVQIGFSSEDPEIAAQVPNRLLSIYFEERDRKLRNRVKVAEEYLLGRIRDQRASVSAAREAVKSFRETSGLISGEAQEDATQVISALSGRRAAIIRERAELTATIASAGSSPDAFETNTALHSDELSELRRILQVQTLDLLRLQRNYGQNHPDVIAKHAEIAETRTAIRREGERHIQSLHARLAALDLEDKAVDSESNIAQQQLSGLMLSETEVSALIRTAEREQAALNALEEQRRQVVAQAGLPFVEAEVLSPATLPLYPEGRGRSFYLVCAILAAGAIAFTVACARELLDTSVRSYRQLRPSSRVRPGGMVPRLKSRRPAEAAASDPAFANAIRGLVLTMQGGNDGKAGECLVVTSAVPGEGKTLIATTIAREFARSRRPVLLVDCNPIGKGTFPFGDESMTGLGDVGDGGFTPDLVQRDRESGVDYIRKGRTDGLRLLDAHWIEQILAHARERSQLVIFDTGPVLACPEATLLSMTADHTLVLLRWGHTSRGAAEAALARLDALSCDDIYVALNMVRPERHALYGFQDFELNPELLRRAYR